MIEFLDRASRFGIPAALVLFAVATGIWWFAKRSGHNPKEIPPEIPPEVPPAAWAMVGLFVVLGVACLAGFGHWMSPYHLRVTVLGPDGNALQNGTVWSLAGSAEKKAEGWELYVPSSARAADGKILVWAATDPGDTTHSQAVLLSQNHHPEVTVRIGAPKTAFLAGRVVDDQGLAVPGVWLTVAGYSGQSTMTQDDGRFRIPANEAPGEDVLLMVTVGRNPLLSMWEKAGSENLTIRLNSQ